ncbi:patatin-like phospholipase family protein [Paenibacillus rhizoplanae]
MEINAVFEGGGVKGIALAGAVEATERAGRTFGRVAGTSSGSIIASLLAAGYSGEAMSRVIRRTPFTSFLTRGALYNTAFVGPALRVLLKKGLYSGQALEAWIRGLLLEQGGRYVPGSAARQAAGDYVRHHQRADCGAA